MNTEKIDYAWHYAQWSISGLTKAGYCKSNEISYQTFMYHAGRIQKSSSKKDFVQIDVPEQIHVSAGIEYHFANGNYFVFPGGSSVQLIKTLIG